MTIKERISEYIHKNIKYNAFDKKTYEKIFSSFIENFYLNKDKSSLLKVVENIKWLERCDISKELDKKIYFIITKSNYENIKLVKFKKDEKYSSSSNYYINNFCNAGYVSDREVVTISNLENLEHEKEYTFILFDDFIGTGDTIEKPYIQIRKNFPIDKIVIFYYAICLEGKDKLIKLKNNDKNLILLEENTIEIRKYEEILEQKEKEIVINVCSKCKDNRYSFGYKDSKILLTIGGISPNNTISMLWYDKFNDEYSEWIPLFNREKNFERIEKERRNFFKKTELLKNQFKIFQKKWKDIPKKFYYRHFLLLLYIRMFGCCDEDIIKIISYDSKEELKKDIKYLTKKLIINENVIENKEVKKLVSKSFKQLLNEINC